MLIFRTTYDLRQLPESHPFNTIIRKCLNSTGHLQGYLILIEEEDTTINLPELQADLKDIQWEGVSKLAGVYHAVYLTNNEFALEFVIPDADWLANDLRATLEKHRV